MKSKRQIKSFWWEPEHSETRWFGTLTLENDETPELELFVERQNSAGGLSKLGKVIHGMDEHGSPITLLYVGSPGENISGAVAKRTFHAGYVLIGIHVLSPEAFSVNSLRFEVQHLYGWLGRTGFQRAPAQTSDTFTVNFQAQPDEWFKLTDDLELGIHNTYSTHNGFQERKISENAALTFRSKFGFGLTRCRELISSIRILLHFAILKKSYPVWITAYKNGYGEQFGEQWIDKDIEVITSNLREPASEYPLPDRWLFRLKDVEVDFAGFMRNWIDYTDKYAEPLGCYSSTIYHSLTDAISHLSITQALETYHGIRFSSHHKHEFKAKIEELLQMHASSLRGLIDDIPAFAETVLCTRNHYTHHNPKWEATGKVAKKADLFRLNEKLQLLFRMCVLSDLGISSDRFTRLRRQLASEIIDYA